MKHGVLSNSGVGMSTRAYHCVSLNTLMDRGEVCRRTLTLYKNPPMITISTCMYIGGVSVGEFGVRADNLC